MSEVDEIKERLQSTWIQQATPIESNIEQGIAKPEEYAQLITLYSLMNKDKKEIKEKADIAIKFIEQDINSGNVTAKNYVSLATIYSTISKFTDKKAVAKYYNLALEIDQNCIEALTGLSSLYSCSIDSNDKAKALGYITRAIEAAPTNDYLYEERASLKVCLGNYDSALEDLEKILELNSDEKMKESVLKQIELVNEAKTTGRFNPSPINYSSFNPENSRYNETPLLKLFTIALIIVGFLYLYYEFFMVK